jgi:hypothetical protein
MSSRTASRAAVVALALYAPLAYPLAIDPFYAGSYTVSSLGSVPGLPAQYGGLTFLDNNTILIGGNANTAAGRLYTIDVVRGAGNHVTGFSGTVSQFGGASSLIGDVNDGGVVFGPGGVLFLARWPANQIGQVAPGTVSDENKIVPGPVGAASSVSALNFVPVGFGGAGAIKIVTWSGGQWYDATLSPDGSGTFDISGFTQVDVNPVVAGTQVVPGGPEGFVYIAAGNPLFPVNTMLISEFSAGVVGAYELDANGNPLVNTRRVFVTELSGAEGAAIDPITGDFLFSTFGGGDQVVVVQGFLAPEPPPSNGVPEPGSLALAGLALLAMFSWQRDLRRKRAVRR